MKYLDKEILQESPQAADDYRQRYVDGFNAYIKRKNAESRAVRSEFISPESLAENPEKYRKIYAEMLGLDKIDLSQKPVEKVYVGSDDLCKIYRLTVYITDEIPFYAVLLIPHNAKKVPLIIAQHGGGGTPELCSDMNGKNNYNHMTLRALSRGAAILAPQLMLWSTEESETMRAHDIPINRRGLDNSLKRFGMTVTGLEISGIMRSLDYVSALEEIDENNIGMVGISYGGYFTMHTMAADTRIKAGYSAAVFNDRDIYDWSDWCYTSSALKFQDAEVAALCAPRKLYVQVGKTDEVFDYKSAVEEVSRVGEYFKAQGCKENFRFSLWDGGHTIPDDDEGFDFLFSAFSK